MTQLEQARSVVNSMGRRIYVLDADERAEALLAASGDFNPPSLAMWRHVLRGRPWDVVVDVGANYGEMLLGVDLPASADVIAFEPNPAVLACLSRSIAEAGLAVDLRGEAVADCAGERDLVLEAWTGRSRLAGVGSPADGLERVRVPVTTLTDALLSSDARSACIKIDVEGAEDLVLAGAEGLFRRLHEVAVLVEVLHRDPDDLATWARDWRMYLYDIRRDGLVRVGRRGPEDVRHLLQLPWIYRQDAVLRNLEVAR